MEYLNPTLGLPLSTPGLVIIIIMELTRPSSLALLEPELSRNSPCFWDQNLQHRIESRTGSIWQKCRGGGFYIPAEYECVIRAHPESNDHGEDVHEGEEGEAEDEGVGEVSKAQGGRYGGERGQGDGEGGGVGPYQQHDQHQGEEQVGGVLQQIGIEQSILQTWK